MDKMPYFCAMLPSERVIMGIDPGTTLMGYGILHTEGRRAEMVTMGVIDLRKYGDQYLKLGHIFERVTGIIESYLPDELAIEAPFFGKNVQSMLKLGRLSCSFVFLLGTSNSGIRTLLLYPLLLVFFFRHFFF